ncbi:MAG TPA: hypothetical protein PLO67_16315, partial [Saprospiraceae bacterium]|nr:hypothetical protein [Saprospiraceae bacterium]HPI07933.1 hypothetical protein [Saprospiraceae bacterium]
RSFQTRSHSATFSYNLGSPGEFWVPKPNFQVGNPKIFLGNPSASQKKTNTSQKNGIAGVWNPNAFQNHPNHPFSMPELDEQSKH